MKDFLKKVFFFDRPAQGAFAGTTLLLVSLWLGPALFLLCGGLANCNAPISRFWQLLFLLPVPLCALYALTSWFHFYLREFAGKKKTVLVLILLALAVVMYLLCSDIQSPAGPVSLILFFILVPLALIPRVWKIILLRCACLLGAFWLVWTIDSGSCFELQLYGSTALLLAGYVFSGLMYAQAAQIPFRQIFGRGVKILWGCVAAGYLISMGMVFVTRARTERAVKDLEKHFAKPFSAQGLKTFYTNGRKVDAAFWNKIEKTMDSIEKEWQKIGSRGLIASSPEGVYPQETLKEFEALMERSGALRELEKMFDRPLPARDIDYKDGELAAVLLPELNRIREFCRWELWQIRFAAGKNDLPSALNVLKRMKNASDYLVNKPSSLIATLVMIGCERYRMQGMEVLLSSGIVTVPVLKQWQSELDRDERKIPQINFDSLYTEAVFAHDVFQAIDRGKDMIYGEPSAPVYRICWFFPPMVYSIFRSQLDLMRRLQVREFGALPRSSWKLQIWDNSFPVKTQQKFDRLSAMYRAMRALIGVELEKRRTGKYPDALAKPPVDPFTGKPMLYRKGRITVNDPVWLPEWKRFDNKAVRHVEGVEIVSAGPNRKNDVGARMIFKQGSAN